MKQMLIVAALCAGLGGCASSRSDTLAERDGCREAASTAVRSSAAYHLADGRGRQILRSHQQAVARARCSV